MRTFEETIYSGPAGPPGGFETPSDPGRRPGDRDARRASLLLLPGIPLALIAGAFWTFLVRTAAWGDGTHDVVEGWNGVVRNLPAYPLGVAISASSMIYATRARRLCAGRNLGGLIASGAGLLFILGGITHNVAELVMTTSAFAVGWLLFAVDLVVVMAVTTAAYRWAARRAQPCSEQTLAE